MIVENENNYDFLKEYSSWNRGKKTDQKITLFDFATFIATPDLIFAMSALFSPKLVAHDGSFFIDQKFSIPNYERWKKQGLSSVEIEKVINHIHMTTILQSSDVDYLEAKKCADLITSMWNKCISEESVKAIVVGEVIEDLAVTIFSDPVTDSEGNNGQ